MRARVSQAVTEFASRGAAWLVGWANGDDVWAVAAARRSFAADELAGLLPVGMYLVGVGGQDAQETDRALQELARDGPRAASRLIAYTQAPDGSSRTCVACKRGGSEKPADCQVAIEEGSKLMQSCALVRLECRRVLLVPTTRDVPSEAELLAAANKETQELRGKPLALYSEEGSSLYVPGGPNAEQTCKEFFGKDREISVVSFVQKQADTPFSGNHRK
eukprot:tig00020903_g15082.t2